MKRRFVAIAAALLTQTGPGLAQEMPFTDTFDDGVLSDSRYVVRTSNDSSSIIVDNGMLRLETSSDGSRAGRAALDLVEPTEYLEADLMLESSSLVEDRGIAQIALMGTFYNDTVNGGVAGERSLGDVLVRLSLRRRGDGTVDNQVCAFRSNDSDFADIEPIVFDGSVECGSLDIDVSTGVWYSASIRLDRENRRLVFALGGATLEQGLQGNIFEPSASAVSSVLLQVNGVGNAVGFADDVSTSIDGSADEEETAPEETTDETTEETTDETTDETADGTTDETEDGTTDGTEGGTTDETTDGMTDGTTDETTDETTDGTTDETDGSSELPADDEVVDGDDDGGSGCSIAGPAGKPDPMLLTLGALALLIPALRRVPGRRDGSNGDRSAGA